MSYLILKIIAPCYFYLFGTSLMSPYYFLLFPRLLMCSISFVSDYCLYKICRIWNRNYSERLILYASSYIMMCYVTRTFSNSIEFIMTSLLLYYVARCMKFSEKVSSAFLVFWWYLKISYLYIILLMQYVYFFLIKEASQKWNRCQFINPCWNNLTSGASKLWLKRVFDVYSNIFQNSIIFKT